MIDFVRILSYSASKLLYIQNKSMEKVTNTKAMLREHFEIKNSCKI